MAVIDTGITDHVEFQGRVLPGYDFISSVAISNDGDGRDPDASDPGDYDANGGCAGSSSWHGTHVAGIIGAVGNNDYGVVGVNWQTSLMSLRILDNNNQSDAAAAIRAINYAKEMRANLRVNDDLNVESGANIRVLNNGWGQGSAKVHQLRQLLCPGLPVWCYAV